MANINLMFIALFSIWAIVPCSGEENLDPLELIVTSAKLPVRAGKFRDAVYDGQDSIYIIGGFDGSSGGLDQVVKYSLDTDQVTRVGTLARIYAGPAVLTHKGEILYYGGFNTDFMDRIYSYSIAHGNSSIISTLPRRIANSAVAWDSENQMAYLFGGNTPRLTSILRHNVDTNEITQVGTLPVEIYRATAVWVPKENGDVAYSFAGDSSTGTHFSRILHFDPEHGNVTTLPVFLPHNVWEGCSVFVENQQQVYLFGRSPLIRFDPTSHNVEELEVEGWPVALEAAACVYVPKLGRMYIMGGMGRYPGGVAGYRDEISYVQLDTPAICPPEGIHNFPYPGNCTLYIRCFHGVPQTLSCYPLRFDTIDLVCKPVADAVCDQEETPTTDPPIPPTPTTMQPEPGLCPPIGYEVFPHESNCSKYYECNDGVAYESVCAANTYFDIHHEIRRCNQAELAVCHAECPVYGIDFQPVRSRGCRWYKICIEGQSTNLECGAGTMYDPQPQRCIPEQEYNCPYAFTV